MRDRSSVYNVSILVLHIVFFRCSCLIRFVHLRTLWLQSNFAFEKVVHDFQKYIETATGTLLSRRRKRLSLGLHLGPYHGSVETWTDSVRRVAFAYGEEPYRMIRIGDRARVRILSDGLIMSVSVLLSGRSRRFSHAHKARARARARIT